MAWVAEDGSYGTCEVIVFDYEDIDNGQWDELDEMGDVQRYNFVANILKAKETK
jgi:beta-xylosidase